MFKNVIVKNRLLLNLVKNLIRVALANKNVNFAIKNTLENLKPM